MTDFNIFTVREASQRNAIASNCPETAQIGKTCTDGLYGLLALIMCILGSCTATLIPLHNVVIYPEFWYEVLVPLTAHFVIYAAFNTVRVKMVFRFPLKKLVSIGLDFLFTSILFCIIIICSGHMLWTPYLGFIEPLPFKCVLMVYCISFVSLARLIFILKQELGMDAFVKRRIFGYICFILWHSFINVQLIAARKLFDVIPLDYQGVLAIVILVSKEINGRVIDKFTTMAAASEDVFDVKIVGKVTTNLQFSLWIAICLALSASLVTSYLFLGIGFCLNLKTCYDAIKWHRKVSVETNNSETTQSFKNEALTELILNETVEVFAPCASIGSFLIAYYGPNYGILGNVGCSYWTFQAPKNLIDLFTPVLLMTVIDTGSAVVAGIALWKFCRINIFWKYCEVIQQFWLIIGWYGSFMLSAVS